MSNHQDPGRVDSAISDEKKRILTAMPSVSLETEQKISTIPVVSEKVTKANINDDSNLQTLQLQALNDISPLPTTVENPNQPQTLTPGAYHVEGTSRPAPNTLSATSTSRSAPTSTQRSTPNEQGVQREDTQDTVDEEEGQAPPPNGNANTLVSASPVSAQEHALDLPYAVPQAKNERRSRTGNNSGFFFGMGVGLCVGMVLLIVVVVLLLVLLLPKEESNNNAQTTMAPILATAAPTLDSQNNSNNNQTNTTTTPLLDLPEYSQDAILQYNSPQYKAYEWLSKHPEIANLQSWRKEQLFALSTVYYALHGDEWPMAIRDRWMQYDRNECNWFSASFVFDLNGFFDANAYEMICPNRLPQCNSTLRDELGRLFRLTGVDSNASICNDDGRYTNLALLALDLGGREGHVPPEVALLPSLEQVSITYSNLNGTLSDYLPSQLEQLPNLTKIELDDNFIAGTVPSSIGRLTGLERFSIGYTSVSGVMPSELWTLTNMKELVLQHSRISEQILPTSIGLLTDLTLVDISTNAWIGPVPSEIGLLSGLQGLDLDGSMFSGQLPTELGLLMHLEELDMARSWLSGTIPTEFGGMLSLAELEFSDTNISGSIPPQVCTLPQLEDIELNCSRVICGCGDICDCD